MQRFVPPVSGGGACAAPTMLALCRPELDALSGGAAPQQGWLAYTYDFARRLLYPEQDTPEPFGPGAVFFLSVLQVLFAAENEVLPPNPAWTFRLLTEAELSGSACAVSYVQMLRCWKREYVYELMRLGLEATPYRTLEHIAGVHHVAMTAGRALHRAGIPVDLALVSGSAAGHDIGKFGCRPGGQVPYLHYYYTDLWFRRRRLTDIGHVAANHSVWDLEPDYLSVESLLLIYADFRVKQSVGPDGREITRISSLSEAFDVILSKLDAVDDAKRQRYMRVYARLRDFEQFMADKGVDVTLQGHDTPPPPAEADGPHDRRGGSPRHDHAVRGPQHGADEPSHRPAQLSPNCWSWPGARPTGAASAPIWACSSPTPCISTFPRRSRRWPFSTSC